MNSSDVGEVDFYIVSRYMRVDDYLTVGDLIEQLIRVKSTLHIGCLHASFTAARALKKARDSNDTAS
jgi:hypothetical protein